MRVLLQSLVFPHPGTPPGSEPLYGRGERVVFRGASVGMEAGGSLDLESYFNIFNEDNWRGHTRIEELFFRVRLRGAARVRIQGLKGVRADAFVSSDAGEERELPLGRGEGVLSVRVEAREDTLLEGGGFYAEVEGSDPRADRVSVVICTFNRAEYLLPNLKLLEQSLPPLWDVVVVDNGRGLDARDKGAFDSRFRFFSNPNTGGSGGFTRGILETLRTGGRRAVLLMDDDVVIEPAALERSAAFYRLLKAEYRGFFLAGAMLRLDAPCVQHEASAVWNGVRVRPLRHNLDLAKPEGLRKAEEKIRGKRQYAAWWYCLVPLDAGTELDLPWPFFVNGDDIEYSLRRAKGILTLNGAAVWHEPFDKKFNPVKQYYLTCRNGLAVNALHGYSRARSLLLVNLRAARLFLRGDRAGLSLLLAGAEDFLSGPETFRKTDAARLLGDPEGAAKALRKGGFRGFLRVNMVLSFRYQEIRRRYLNIKPDREFWEEYLERRGKGDFSC